MCVAGCVPLSRGQMALPSALTARFKPLCVLRALMLDPGRDAGVWSAWSFSCPWVSELAVLWGPLRVPRALPPMGRTFPSTPYGVERVTRGRNLRVHPCPVCISLRGCVSKRTICILIGK